MSASIIPVPIERIDGADTSAARDVLAVEEPLEIRVDGRSISITMRTPGEDAELAAGFLFSEGIIGCAAHVRSIVQADEGDPNVVAVHLADSAPRVQPRAERHFVMTSACGVCGKSSLADLQANACPILPADDLQISAAVIHSLPDRLRPAQSAFAATGGIHAAARFTLDGELECMREDVGRHNALDKLIGAAVLAESVPLNRSLLLVSGRASFELVQKALMAGFPVLAAVGAPSSLAVSTAQRSGMTLIGFLRNSRFNVYSGEGRLRHVPGRTDA